MIKYGRMEIILKKGLKELGFNIGNSETPITPCIIGDEVKTQEFSKKLI